MAANQRHNSNHSAVNPAILSWLRNALQPAYRDQVRTFDDTVLVLKEYKSIRLKTEVFTYPNGETRLLLMLHGTIPIDFRNRSYNIPLNIWLNHDYPKSAPIIFVVPSTGMGIRTSNHVDIDRRCYHPYLAYWTDDPRKSALVVAIRYLQDVFSREPPLYTASQDVGDDRRVEQSVGGQSQGRGFSLDRTLVKPRSPPPRPAKLPQEHMSGQQEALAGQEKSPKRTPPALPPPPPASFRTQSQTTERFRGFPATSYQSQDCSSVSGNESIKNTEQYSDRMTLQKPVDQDRIESDPKVQQNLLLTRIYTEIDNQCTVGLKHHMSEIHAIEQNNSDMMQRIKILESIEQQLQRLSGVTLSNSSILSERLQKARSVIDASAHSSVKDLDHILVAQNVVYNQLYELVADELGLEDTIYALGKAFEVERIDLDSFLKYIRSLAREQFMQRALIAKISKTLNLQV